MPTYVEYFMPDSRDAVDSHYDFEKESTHPDRVTRDDLYCHEVLPRPYDGILLSYTALEKGRYSAAARRRLLRDGAQRFFRAPPWMRFMGDCGAFSYFDEDVPPYSVETIADYYATIGANLGLAVDHIVPGYAPEGFDKSKITPNMRRRFDITLDFAAAFLKASKGRAYEPVGVLQGWDPESYCAAAKRLQAMGYTYLALGGIVRLKTPKIVALLEALDTVRQPNTRLHLLGVARSEAVQTFARYGVASVDSTSPLRRAWMDKRRNYWLGGDYYSALRVPPSTSSRIRKRLESGELDGCSARRLEQRALNSLSAYARRGSSLDETLEALLAYQRVHSPNDEREADYRATLSARPWESCTCNVCARLGHHVIMLRGAERNRNRGFHNVGVFYRNFSQAQNKADVVLVACGSAKLRRAAPASELYTGSLFKAHMKLAAKFKAPIMIMSALHGLLDPGKVTAHYECSLNSMPKAKRVAWGLRLLAELRERLPHLRKAVVFAGKNYLTWKDGCGFEVVDPLAGYTLGRRLQAAKESEA